MRLFRNDYWRQVRQWGGGGGGGGYAWMNLVHFPSPHRTPYNSILAWYVYVLYTKLTFSLLFPLWREFYICYKAGLRTQSRQSAKLFLQSSDLELPLPLGRRRVCPPTLWSGGRAHSLAGEGSGESQFRRGDIHWGALYINKYFVTTHVCLEQKISFFLFRFEKLLNCFWERCLDTRSYKQLKQIGATHGNWVDYD